LEAVVHPVILYAGLALGALGVSMALPRPRISPQVIGSVIGAAALAGVLVSMALKAGDEAPGVYFYIFSVIALGSALRVISHPRPVYSALYFIVTILSSAALYLMLHAEFMAFALIIIYAGAILITYLFVIMLAEQAPSEGDVEGMAVYDRFSREPTLAAGVGFALLAALSFMILRGVGSGELTPPEPRDQTVLLTKMPKKVLASLDRKGVFEAFVRPDTGEVAAALDPAGRAIWLEVAGREKFLEAMERSDLASLLGETEELRREVAASAQEGAMVRVRFPDDLRVENIDGVGFELIAGHPMALELAGVILLMAMLGAVVLARKQIEIVEMEKEIAARTGPATDGSANGSPMAGGAP